MKKFIIGSLLAIFTLSTTVAFTVFLIMPTAGFNQIYFKSILVVASAYAFLLLLALLSIEIIILIQNFQKKFYASKK